MPATQEAQRAGAVVGGHLPEALLDKGPEWPDRAGAARALTPVSAGPLRTFPELCDFTVSRAPPPTPSIYTEK